MRKSPGTSSVATVSVLTDNGSPVKRCRLMVVFSQLTSLRRYITTSRCSGTLKCLKNSRANT